MSTLRESMEKRGGLLRVATAAAVAGLLLWAEPAAADFASSVAAVRRAMAERELDQAAEQIKAARAAATTQPQQDEVARLESLLEYQRQFWDLISKGAAKLQGGEELVIGNTRVAFVEWANGGIVVKAAGQLHRYTIKTMPTSLALALAERSLAKDAVSKVVVGSFLAMDAKGDRKAARQLWDDAARAGLDVAHLNAELDTPGGGKSSVPTDDTKLKIAESQIQQEYKQLFSRVGVAVWREQLIRKLLDAAPKLEDDPVRRYVMLRDARDLAAAAGQSREAQQAIELIARYYDVDVVNLKLEVLEKLAASARGLDATRDVTLETLELSRQAAKEGKLDVALSAAKLAVEAARKTRNRVLLQQATMLQREIDERLHPPKQPKR